MRDCHSLKAAASTLCEKPRLRSGRSKPGLALLRLGCHDRLPRNHSCPERIAGDDHVKMAHLTFRGLLTAFAAAVEANDGDRLASLFTEDGTYEDGFFGVHTGRPAIATMLQRFHDTGRAYLWEFLDPLSDGAIGYARFRFSYASLLPEAVGRPVFFEGMSCFRFRDGLIAHYGEAFDRGIALVRTTQTARHRPKRQGRGQLDFSAERIKHILADR